MNRPDLVEAIFDLCPDAQFRLVGQSLHDLEWLSTSALRPSDDDIENRLANMLKTWKDDEYQRKRGEEYPSLADLIVALWERDIEQRPNAALQIQSIRQMVKLKYPKPDRLP